MAKPRHLLTAALLASTLIACTNCASSNVNPPQAKPHKGYVDFYCPGNTNVFWDVKRADPGTEAYKTVFSRLKPLPEGVLRLELAPGLYQFKITFLNRVIHAPLTVQVRVQEGMVTPVKVELVPMGETSVASKQQEVGVNVSGAGRKTTYSTQAGTIERLVASVQPPTAYRPKEQTNHPP
jgi:hypothetical protein